MGIYQSLHQYVECLKRPCCPGEHCAVCGQETGSEAGRARGCRWDLAALVPPVVELGENESDRTSGERS